MMLTDIGFLYVGQERKAATGALNAANVRACLLELPDFAELAGLGIGVAVRAWPSRGQPVRACTWLGGAVPWATPDPKRRLTSFAPEFAQINVSHNGKAMNEDAELVERVQREAVRKCHGEAEQKEAMAKEKQSIGGRYIDSVSCSQNELRARPRRGPSSRQTGVRQSEAGIP